MSIRIVQYQSPPGTASFGEPQFFGGDALQPVVAGDGGILKSTATRLVLDGGSFSGLKATLFGDFNYFGGAISGHVNRIKFFYDYGEGSVPFQDWRKVNWDVEEVTAVIDGFEDGDETAFDDFLAGFDYTFVIHKNHYGHVMTTDGDDTVVAQNVSGADAVHFIMTFGGDDTLNLKRMKADTYIETGTGKDVVRGGSGDDQIRSAAGRDVIKGGGGRDNIDGQAGRDKIYGQGGDDTYLSGGARNDKIWGGAGNDEINDTKGYNKLFGQAGDDMISGKGHFKGGTGDDTLLGHHKSADIFDFRLGKSDSFGDDKVFGTFSRLTKGIKIDEIWLDEGVDVSLVGLPRSGDVLLTAERDEVEVGTVRFDFASVGEIENALVYL